MEAELYLQCPVTSTRWKSSDNKGCKMASLKALLRALPCRPSELPHFRAAAVSVYRDSSRPEVVRELSFYFESLRKQKELNDRYFPQSELKQSERMAKLANVVGLEMPESSKD